MDKMVIRKLGDSQYRLMDSQIVQYGDKKYKNAYWLECDDDGNIVDSNGDGIVSNKTILCKIPDGHEDIDLSTLKEDCLQ